MPIQQASVADTALIARHEAARDDVVAFARRHDVAVWEGIATISKHWADGDRVDPEPYEVIEDHNILTTVGATALLNLLVGAGGTAYNVTNGYLAVGTGSTAASAAQTALVTESARVVFDAAPTVSTNTVTFKSTFGTAVANVAWSELGTFNASSAGTMLNRLQGSYGTKTSSASWTLSMALSIS